MPILVNIGYRRYVVSSQAKAAAIISALSDALQVKHGGIEDHKEFFVPDEDADKSLGMEVITEAQIRRHRARTIPRRPAPEILEAEPVIINLPTQRPRQPQPKQITSGQKQLGFPGERDRVADGLKQLKAAL